MCLAWNPIDRCELEKFLFTLNDGSVREALLHSLPGRQVLALVDNHDGHGSRVSFVSVYRIPRVTDLFIDVLAFAGPQKFSPRFADFLCDRRPKIGGLAQKVVDIVAAVVAASFLFAFFLLHSSNGIFQAFFLTALFFVLLLGSRAEGTWRQLRREPNALSLVLVVDHRIQGRRRRRNGTDGIGILLEFSGIACVH